MAEISAAEEPAVPAAPVAAVTGDVGEKNVVSGSVRSSLPGTKRLFLSLSVLLSFLLGLPFLLKSTAIYRSPLPFSSIESLASQLRSHPPALPCRFQAIFLRPVGQQDGQAHAERLHRMISGELRRIAASGQRPSCGSCEGNYSLSVVIDSGEDCFNSEDDGNGCRWRCGAIRSSDLIGDDEGVDELLESAITGGGSCSSATGGRIYTTVVESDNDNTRVVVGKHRHAWITGRNSEIQAIGVMGNIFVKLFMNGGKAEEVDEGKGDYMPVGADGSLTLSFSLLNADPKDWIYDWDFRQIADVWLAPVIRALSPIASISVESQVLYHAPKSSLSSWDETLRSHSFSIEDLPFFKLSGKFK